VCQRLFYLECGDYIDDEGAPAATDDAGLQAASVQDPEAAIAFVVSLQALAGIRTESSMVLSGDGQGGATYGSAGHRLHA
jgi:hypothetical protein